MLMPRKVAHRKHHRGRTRGMTKGGSSRTSASSASRRSSGWLTARQIEAASYRDDARPGGGKV
jgi:large subunit ribosomal protein L16